MNFWASHDSCHRVTDKNYVKLQLLRLNLKLFSIQFLKSGLTLRMLRRVNNAEKSREDVMSNETVETSVSF